jgi:hypothetical protein
MLLQVSSLQPSERWTCAMRNSSMWPLKGSAMPLTCRPMPSAAELIFDGQRIAHLRDTRAVQIEALVVRAGRGREAMPGSMMQRKSGFPTALPQQAW